MNYRTMELRDYDRVIALWQHCQGVSLRDADSREGIARYLERNPNLSFIAEDQGEVIGTIMAGHDGKRGYIQHLAVCDSQRQQGIGSHLVEICIEALKDEGIVKSHVHVLSDNQLGRNFWLHQDWLPRDEIVMYSFINGDNANS